MDRLFEYLFLYCVCATAGWLIEVIYRGIRHRKVVNPGFLTGCCLPIYGIGGVLLY
ncbi:MAG: phosphohydrolase, partial [Clostridia bacterium]|nr:phosphohydrolase [Clostridia bacterium]